MHFAQFDALHDGNNFDELCCFLLEKGYFVVVEGADDKLIRIVHVQGSQNSESVLLLVQIRPLNDGSVFAKLIFGGVGLHRLVVVHDFASHFFEILILLLLVYNPNHRVISYHQQHRILLRVTHNMVTVIPY